MRITFITSSLAPGRDGVGDYTRDLAAACASLGHTSTLLSLNDRHASGVSEELQSARGEPLPTLRLPVSASWGSRLPLAQRWIEQQAPDWISLHFVPYGYHPKGLIGDLGRRLLPLIGGRPVQLMMHELWIATERGASLRHRFVGAMQRRAVLAMIRALQPAVIHTSNATYAQLLRAQEVHARVLPMCGSIPITSDPDPQWLGQEFIKLGVPPGRALPRETTWRFGIFGTLLSVWSPEPLFSYIAEAAQRARREVIIASIGRPGPGGSIWQPLQSRYASQFSFAALGERSPAEVSTFFQGIDFGIAMTPWQLIGKSAATAAMLDHGVPVVVPRVDTDFGIGSNEPASPLLHPMSRDTARWLLEVRPMLPRSRLSDMAARFLADIAEHKRSRAEMPVEARVSSAI
jgi:hypothetical protein